MLNNMILDSNFFIKCSIDPDKIRKLYFEVVHRFVIIFISSIALLLFSTLTKDHYFTLFH